jgi:hypothetical protein
MDPFYVLDDAGNPISNLLFQSVYANTETGDQIIQVGSDVNDLSNVVIQTYPVDSSLIPNSMRDASAESYKYVELSLNEVGYSNKITIDSIPYGTYKKIYVKLDVPDYADEGNFLCGIKVTATYLN